MDQGTEGHPVFVGDLPLDISEEELNTVFKTYGTVKRIKVLTDADRKPLGNAVVFYQAKKAAEDAITVLHKAYKIREGASKPIRVSWAVRGKTAGPSSSAPARPEPAQRPAEERRPAARVRPAAQARSPPRVAPRVERRDNRRPERSRSRGRGEDSRDRAGPERRRQVLRARESRSRDRGRYGDGIGRYGDGEREPKGRGWPSRLDEELEDGWGYRGGYGGRSGKGRKSKDVDDGDWGGKGKGRWAKGGGKEKGRSKGRNGSDVNANSRLYVEKLPRDITEGALKEAFGTYGEVLGVKIIPSRGSGSACAFVRYSTVSAAETAIATVDGKYEMQKGDGPISAKFARPNPKWD